MGAQHARPTEALQGNQTEQSVTVPLAIGHAPTPAGPAGRALSAKSASPCCTTGRAVDRCLRGGQRAREAAARECDTRQAVSGAAGSHTKSAPSRGAPSAALRDHTGAEVGAQPPLASLNSYKQSTIAHARVSRRRAAQNSRAAGSGHRARGGRPRGAERHPRRDFSPSRLLITFSSPWVHRARSWARSLPHRARRPAEEVCGTATGARVAARHNLAAPPGEHF